MQRADIGIYRYRRPVGIYCGLISGYTAKLAGMATRKALTKWLSLRDIPWDSMDRGSPG
jgi:hypothetical protein